MTHDDTNRQPYEAPSITEHGSVADLTNANALKTAIDASFPSGTPLGSMTGS